MKVDNCTGAISSAARDFWAGLQHKSRDAAHRRTGSQRHASSKLHRCNFALGSSI